MKLVDDHDEQDVPESLLEWGKPAAPRGTGDLDYLLATPFRYPPHHGGSRFRAATGSGVFYGAETVRNAGVALDYWRWKFLQDEVYLERIEPVAHTAFRAEIACSVVDLQRPPLDADGALWQHVTNYLPTQQFARIAREAEVGGILYRSVRDPSRRGPWRR